MTWSGIDRRMFLGGAGVAVATVPQTPLSGSNSNGSSAVPSKNAAINDVHKNCVSPMDFGAVGDCVTDDRAAVAAAFGYAFENGCPIDGGGRRYGVRGSTTVSNKTRPYIRQLRLHQLDPATGRVTLNFERCQQIRIDDLEINVGNAARLGRMDSTVGLLVHGGSGHKISNVDATGNGKVTYVRFWGCTGSTFENIYVHDGLFEDFETQDVTQDGVSLGTIRVPDDVVQGIHLSDCVDCSLVNPIVHTLLGNATYFNSANQVKDWPNFRTRGICGGGNISCTILNPKVTNVEQSIDFSGSGNGWGNRTVQIIGGHTRNGGSCGVKFANAPNGCTVIGHTAENCGIYCFLLTGSDTSQRGSDNSFIDCVAINPGYNDIRSASDLHTQTYAGFRLLQSASGGLIGSRLLNCRSIDKQGFYLATDDSPWALPGATSAIMAEAWSGYTGSYPAMFATSSGTETKTVTLTNGSTTVTWTGGLSGPIIHPFVSRPAKMQFGALAEAPYFEGSLKPNTLTNFVSEGHIKGAENGFQRYRCNVKGATGQPVPNNTNTAIQWDVNLEDTLGMHSTSVNNSRITFPKSGVYRLHGVLTFAASSNGYRRVQINVNDAAQFTWPYSPISGDSTVTPFNIELAVTVGQYVEVIAKQTSGDVLFVDRRQSFVIVELLRDS